jgi:gluconokinase
MSTTLVVMGVSGSGKTTVASEVARRLGWVFAEGDDFHPAANVAKMRAGQPLTDEDRQPWLHALADWIGTREAAGDDAVLTCSALRRTYRDVLAHDHPSVRFVHVTASPANLRERLERRTGHYMPASLLDSQLATLQPLEPDEPGLTLPGDDDPSAGIEAVLARL